jgi:DeoR/GlpR family transcriptional regulator of sugar metabolism
VFVAQRRQAILEMVRAGGAVSLRDLAAAFDTSDATIRRDLRQLEAEGLLGRSHGGAIARDTLSHEPSYVEKSRTASAEKSAIAELAAGLVSDGDAIVVGPGTTTECFARQLVRARDVTVVTNSLLVASALLRATGIDVEVTGGSVRGSIHALVGSVTENALHGLRMHRAFLSGNGLTAGHGLSTPNRLVAGVDRAIAEAAEEVVVLADHTKLGVDTMVQTVAPGRISHLVTDSAADPAVLDELRDTGITVHVATVSVPAG